MKRVALFLSAPFVLLVGCSEPTTPPEQQPPTIDAQLRQRLAASSVVPIGEMPAQDPALVELGRVLFFDRVLSGNRDIACATCHHPTTSLGDGLALSVGTGGTGIGSSRTLGAGRQFVPRSAPSLLNAGLGLTYFFWDGRLTRNGPRSVGFAGGPLLPTTNLSDALAAQAMLPVVNRDEMLGKPGDLDVHGNANELAALVAEGETAVWEAIMRRLLAIPEYVDMFAAAFPSKPASALRFEDAAVALATFQKHAFTRTHSPFDRYLERDNGALTIEQKRGALVFFADGRCGSCHGGPFLGGQQFANVGMPQIGPGGKKEPPLDLGRGEIQENASAYRFAFRVAPLRNVELTAPYMHSGAYSTLDAVVRHYDNVPRALRSYDITLHAPALRDQYHGDAATVNSLLGNLDHRLRTPFDFTEAEMRDLVAFLKSLTDPTARDLRAIAPARVPSGLPVQ